MNFIEAAKKSNFVRRKGSAKHSGSDGQKIKIDDKMRPSEFHTIVPEATWNKIINALKKRDEWVGVKYHIPQKQLEAQPLFGLKATSYEEWAKTPAKPFKNWKHLREAIGDYMWLNLFDESYWHNVYNTHGNGD